MQLPKWAPVHEVDSATQSQGNPVYGAVVEEEGAVVVVVLVLVLVPVVVAVVVVVVVLQATSVPHMTGME